MFPTFEWRKTPEEGQGHAVAAHPKDAQGVAPDTRQCDPDHAPILAHVLHIEFERVE